MEQLNSNIERVIEPNSTIEVLNVGAFYALVKAYKYVVVSGKSVKEKINVPFTFDLYNKDNEKISSGTISPGEKATFKVPTYKMIINNTYDYEVHIVYSFGSGTVSQLKTDLEMTTEDIAALTAYNKLDYEQLVSINQHTNESYEELDKITRIIEDQTSVDKTPRLLQKFPIFIALDSTTNTYFNVIDLALYKRGITPTQDQKHFITHVDISFDYSQAQGISDLYVTNTFNPAMSFGQYAALKNLGPESITHWIARKWTDRADNHLPTRSSSLDILGGRVLTEGHFRVDINEPYGYGDYIIDNFILRTDIIHQFKAGATARKTAIRTYTNHLTSTPAHPIEKVLTGTYDFKKYNKCAVQQPIRATDSNMLMIDVTVYGYLLLD